MDKQRKIWTSNAIERLEEGRQDPSLDDQRPSSTETELDVPMEDINNKSESGENVATRVVCNKFRGMMVGQNLSYT